jgi:hypothetical protein
MAIDASKVQWDAAPAIDLSAVQWDAAPAPGFFTRLGRGAASLADVTVGGVLPAIAQQVAYPLARVGRTPEQAQAAARGVVSAVEQPFGKAFGVSNTPEYQQESGRQLLDFIGQNIQKGAKWISNATGVPTPDVENMMGTLTVAAPLAKPLPGAIKQAVAPAIERAVVGAKMPFEPMLQARREAASLKDYARGPQLDAAAEAQRLGIALNPVDIQPTAGPRMLSAVAGEKGVEAITAANKNKIRDVALNELDLPPTTQLNGGAAFDAARAKLAAPYDEVRRLPVIVADDAARAALERLRPDESLIGSKTYAKSINAIIDDALVKAGTGLDGTQLLNNVRTLRQRARKIYNNKNADLPAIDVADTNLAVANALESMIESNISNPKLLGQFRDARQKMARTYAYEAATDFNTGMVDVQKLARVTGKDNALTGDIASLGRIAGNFPEAFTNKAASPWTKALSVGRTGAAGTLGGLAGYTLGQDYISAALGSVLGATGGKLAQSYAANRMASPGYQAGLNLSDARLPINQLATSMQPIPQNRAVVPYEAPVEVLDAQYKPNFVAQPNQYPPRVTPVAPEMRNALPAPSAESTLNMLAQERGRAAGMSRTLGQQAEAQQAAAEAAARAPTGAGQLFDLDPITGRLVSASAGIKGATPATFSDFGMALKTAAEKVTAGRNFDLTAAEKVAWNKTKIDFATAAPELKGMSDAQIAGKIMDREWAAGAAQKAREKAQAFDDIAQRAQTAQARRSAEKSRDELLDALDAMEENMRGPRPTRSGAQGPKTRAAIKNQMAPAPTNRLILE